MVSMAQLPAAAFLRDPITVSRKELIEHYRTQAIRYEELAERQQRSSIYKGLLGIARECAAMADVLATSGANRSASARLSETEILSLLDDVICEAKSQSSVPAAQPALSLSVAAVPRRELSLDEILQKVSRDIIDGRPAAAD